jgi:hypothetical protein
MIVDANFKIKFRILCENEEEWIEVQKYLFEIGYHWSQGKVIQSRYYPFQEIIKNYKTGDTFGGKNLIRSNIEYISKNDYVIKASSYLRKEKLKKINVLWN